MLSGIAGDESHSGRKALNPRGLGTESPINNEVHSEGAWRHSLDHLDRRTTGRIFGDPNWPDWGVPQGSPLSTECRLKGAFKVFESNGLGGDPAFVLIVCEVQMIVALHALRLLLNRLRQAGKWLHRPGNCNDSGAPRRSSPQASKALPSAGWPRDCNSSRSRLPLSSLSSNPT